MPATYPTSPASLPSRPVALSPLFPPEGITRPAGRVPIRVPVRRPPSRLPAPAPAPAPPIVVTPSEEEEGGWSTGEKIAVGGVLAIAAIAAFSAFTKKKAPAKTANRRRNRGLSDGWHWYRKTAAVLIRKGRPAKVAGTGSVSSAKRGLESFVGRSVSLKGKIQPPRKLVGSGGWAYSVEVA